MIIGFDAKRIVRNGTGLGAYGRTLANDLARHTEAGLELLLYAPDRGRDDLRSQIAESEHLRFVYPDGYGWPMGHSWWRTHGIVSDLKRDGVELFHGLTGELPRGLKAAGIPGVVTIHDLIFMRHPEYYHWADTRLYTWKFHSTLREATRIVAISERTRQDIAELGGISPDRIDLVYQSCDPRFTTPLAPDELQTTAQHHRLPCRFVLSVGSIEERKNTLLLVKALPLLPQDIDVVLVGKHTAYTDRVIDEARRTGMERRLHVLHGVNDHDLQALYQLAEVFAYPSRYEGFGIPIIEAIFSHLPVVACTGSCLEEAGGPDSLYVRPDDAEDMAHAITQLLRGAPEREARMERSLQYVQRFRGRDVAAQMIDIYRQCLH
jgi:glycosyltransferase involved in cell wall biosynthesis